MQSKYQNGQTIISAEVPDDGDLGGIFWPAIKRNWERYSGHNHDGITSKAMNSSSISNATGQVPLTTGPMTALTDQFQYDPPTVVVAGGVYTITFPDFVPDDLGAATLVPWDCYKRWFKTFLLVGADQEEIQLQIQATAANTVVITSVVPITDTLVLMYG